MRSLRRVPRSHVALVTLQELHTAVASGDASIVRDMLLAGADVDQQDEFGSTPLHRAAWQGDILIVQALLSYGANVEASRNDGKTPLDLVEQRARSGFNPPEGLSEEKLRGNTKEVFGLLYSKSGAKKSPTTFSSVATIFRSLWNFVETLQHIICSGSLKASTNGVFALPDKEHNFQLNDLSFSSESTCASYSELKREHGKAPTTTSFACLVEHFVTHQS